MRIAIGADHGGVDYKDHVAKRLREAGHDVEDVGTQGSGSVDYPDFGAAVARRVQAGEAERGLLFCTTGQGMAMTANKFDGVRAGVVADPFSAQMIVAHNNASVCCVGAGIVGLKVADQIVDAFLGAEFEGGRHSRRVGKIEAATP
jgi:ribose 5-phosphate isomerase B